MDQEIDDPIIIIKGNEALCYLQETFWVRALDNVLGGVAESAGGHYNSILLEKRDNSWFIRYDLFDSAYTVIPPEAPLVKVEGPYPSIFFLVSGFPSFEEILSSLSTQPQWYIEMMEKANSVTSRPSSPDRGAAATYAETWWNSYNPSYPPFDYYNDCANFVSQCLHKEGGCTITRVEELGLYGL